MSPTSVDPEPTVPLLSETMEGLRSKRNFVFAQDWSTSAAETGWSAAALEPAAADTDQFSFAYLKELVISSVMKWMHSPASNFAVSLTAQAALLRRQMTTADSQPPLAPSHNHHRTARATPLA
jgi:hypothetical protein